MERTKDLTMTIDEKKLLTYYLHKYMDWMAREDYYNGFYNYDDECYVSGVKAQYDHARCICRKLEKELSDNFKT